MTNTFDSEILEAVLSTARTTEAGPDLTRRFVSSLRALKTKPDPHLNFKYSLKVEGMFGEVLRELQILHLVDVLDKDLIDISRMEKEETLFALCQMIAKIQGELITREAPFPYSRSIEGMTFITPGIDVTVPPIIDLPGLDFIEANKNSQEWVWETRQRDESCLRVLKLSDFDKLPVNYNYLDATMLKVVGVFKTKYTYFEVSSIKLEQAQERVQFKAVALELANILNKENQ